MLSLSTSFETCLAIAIAIENFSKSTEISSIIYNSIHTIMCSSKR